MSEHRETSLEKGLNVLHHLSSASNGMTVSELATALGYPESTVNRQLQTLKQVGYVWQDRRRGPYKIGYRVLELAGNLLEGMELRRIARASLHELASRTGMIAYLKVKAGPEVVTIDVAVPPMATGLEGEIGRRMPLHCCSPGKAILAARSDAEVDEYIATVGLIPLCPQTITDHADFLEEMRLTRHRGYAVNRQESGDINSIAAPVKRFDGKAIASLAVSFSPLTNIWGTEQEHIIAQEVMAAAQRVSFSIGYQAGALV
jgi:DNA-binding IclR family transcriptional regulator